MTDVKFCDIHKSEDGRRQPKENIRKVTIEQWMKVEGSNRKFINSVDACMPCITETIVARAQGLKVDFQNNWKTEIWNTGANGKKYKTLMSRDELVEYLRETEKAKELAELKARALGR